MIPTSSEIEPMFSKEKALPGPSLDEPRNSQELYGGRSFNEAETLEKGNSVTYHLLLRIRSNSSAGDSGPTRGHLNLELNTTGHTTVGIASTISLGEFYFKESKSPKVACLPRAMHKDIHLSHPVGPSVLGMMALHDSTFRPPRSLMKPRG